MKTLKVTLPVSYKGNEVSLGIERGNPYIGFYNRFRRESFQFMLDKKILLLIGVMVSVAIYAKEEPPKTVNHYYNFPEGVDAVPMPVGKEVYPAEPEMERPLPEMEEELDVTFKMTGSETFRQAFLKEKQRVMYRYITRSGVSRPDQLDDLSLLEMNRKISDLYIEKILKKLGLEKHVLKYFTDTTDLKKVETALMEQAKFHVPASIKLAQSALETSYGRKVQDNNYFGIKDKSRRSKLKTTIEYYNAKEVARNKSKIVSMQKIKKNGKEFYKCKIRDYFEEYRTPWQSFRAHSIYLSNSQRYAPLFTKGKRFEEWADKIGSTKYGGVGYATSPIYGEILKSIIRRYHLDLLDH